MTKEEKTILDGILEQQKKQTKVSEDIQEDLMQFEQDHLVVVKLKSEVAGLRDDVDKLIAFIHKNQDKVAVETEKSVKKGLEPVHNLMENIGNDMESGKLPVTKEMVSSIKRENWLLRQAKKWDKYNLLGKEKKGTRG